MAFKECFGLGFFIGSLFILWFNIIYDVFFNRDKNINGKGEN